MILKKAYNHFIKYGFVSLLKNSRIHILFHLKYLLFPPFVVNYIIEMFSKISAPSIFLKLSPVQIVQSSDKRNLEMIKLIKDNFDKPINILEIGTWFGKGSTQIWFEHVPLSSTITLVDTWDNFVSNEDLKGNKSLNSISYKILRSMNDLPFTALLSTLKEVFHMEKKRKDLRIITIRGKTRDVLPSLAENYYDLIYIDGSHYYKDVKNDIQMSKKIAKKSFSIICGDDYELDFDARLLEIAKKSIDKDFIETEYGAFHPGVFLAIHDEFTKVNMKNGFWWIKNLKDRYVSD